jgi:hypothetical protein
MVFSDMEGSPELGGAAERAIKPPWFAMPLAPAQRLL